MTAAAPWLWDLAGRPGHGHRSVELDEPTPCLVCAAPTEAGVRGKDALGVNFDFTQAARPDSTWVCGGCCWALAGKPPATLRMWSIVADPARVMPASHPKCAVQAGPHVLLTNRADMRTVAAMLTDPPDGEWLVTIAVSGQKHVVPYAQVNRGAGPWRIRFETCDVTSTPAEMAWLLGRVAALRQAEFGPDQIAQVDPGTHLSSRDRLAAWKAHGEPLTPYRGSPLLGLAAAIPNREHLSEYCDRYPA